MPSFKSANSMFGAASQGLSRLAAALMTKNQAYQQGYDNENLTQSRTAQVLSQIGLHDAQAEKARRETDLLTQEADLGKPDAVLSRAMLATGVPQDAQSDVQQYLNTGRIDKYDAGGLPGPVMPAPDWASKANLGAVAKRIAGSNAVLGGEAKDAQDYFKGQSVLRDMGLSDQIIAGTADRNKVGGAEAAVAGKPLYNSDESGAVLDLFGGNLDTNNPMAKSSIALKGAQAGAQNASAASSYASADNSRASALKTKAEIDRMLTGGGAISDPSKRFEAENKLRDEYQKASQPFVMIRDAYGKVQAAAKDPSPAGDIAMIFAYMKILDPTSVVREGEFATAQNAASIPDQIRNSYNKAIQGTRLNPNQRVDFVNQARKVYAQQDEAQKLNARNYTILAKNYGLSFDNVITPYAIPLDNAGPSAPSSGVQSGGRPPLDSFSR